MASLIFLSHIHEESILAQEVQKAIEEEFSGFVEVFVSSDGKTIPAGANFLKRIEDGLVNCIGAIYLISPISVKRNWINFELGAIWIRNSISLKTGGPEIPTIPFCHSGITPSQLPMPLTNLSSIQSNNSSQLELAFKSIQSAVGGKGNLKTNFDSLAKNIIEFEKQYTLGDSLIELFKIIFITNSEMNQIISQCNLRGRGHNFLIQLGFRDSSLFKELKNLETNNLKGHIEVNMKNPGLSFGNQGAVNGGDISFSILTNTILDFGKVLNEKIK